MWESPADVPEVFRFRFGSVGRAADSNSADANARGGGENGQRNVHDAPHAQHVEGLQYNVFDRCIAVGDDDQHRRVVHGTRRGRR